MGDVAERALDSGHYYPMTHVEVSKFAEIYEIPQIEIFNAIHSEETDPADIRVYGGKQVFTAVMWNKMFNCLCRQRFDIKDFPFDHQNLSLELRLNDPRTWDKFNLTVNLVQFHKAALLTTEWTCHAPTVKRDSPKERVSVVHLKIVRYAAFYLQNVVAIMFCLSLLGLVAFAMDISDLGSRVSTLLTLLLTEVAFKFILAGTLPKVPYNTLIDYFVMSSMMYVAIMTLFCILPHIVTDVPSVQAEINQALALVSVSLIGGTGLIWLAYAYYIRSTKVDTERIAVKSDKNWYSFRFADPPFLIPFSSGRISTEQHAKLDAILVPTKARGSVWQAAQRVVTST